MTAQTTAERYASIPQELKDRAKWARWKRTPASDKLPTNIDDTAMFWQQMPETRLAFNQVEPFRTIGWFIDPSFEIIVIDLDGCRDKETGIIHPLVQHWIDQSHSYAEISQSGTGVKLYLRGTIPGNKPIINTNVPWRTSPDQEHIGIELYAENKFIAITGNKIPGCPSEIADAHEVRIDILLRFAPAPKQRKNVKVDSGDFYNTFVGKYLEVVESVSDGHNIVCPWASEHSTPGDTARIWEGPPHTFNCFHAHCANRTWRDVRLHFEPHAYDLPQYNPEHDTSDSGVNGAKDPIKEAVKISNEDQRLVIGAKGKKVLKSDSLEDVLNYPDPEYLIAKILEVATVSLMYGESGTGKTFIALAIALAVAFGRDWLGRSVKQGSVLYFYQEGKLGLKKRVNAWLDYYAVKNLPSTIRFITVPVHLLHDREYILNAIEEQNEPPSLLIIDTFSNCAPGVNQSHQEEVYPILAVGHEIAKQYGSHFLMVHHDNKSGDYNGSKAFRNHVDTMLLVEKGNSDGSIILSSKKSREEEPFTDIALQLLRVELDKELSSCVVTTSDAKTVGSLSQPQFQCLELLYDAGSLTSKEWERRCEKAYKMPHTSWSRNRGTLENQRYVEAPNVQRGVERSYTVTQKGEDILTSTTSTKLVPGTSGTTDHQTSTTSTTPSMSGTSGTSGEFILKSDNPMSELKKLREHLSTHPQIGYAEQLLELQEQWEVEPGLKVYWRLEFNGWKLEKIKTQDCMTRLLTLLGSEDENEKYEARSAIDAWLVKRK
jgi:hypothetical protein